MTSKTTPRARHRAYVATTPSRYQTPRKPRVVRVTSAPVGDARANECIDSICEHCGYQVCNCAPCARCGDYAFYCRGTCAPKTEAPAPAAPAEHASDPIAECVRLGIMVTRWYDIDGPFYWHAHTPCMLLVMVAESIADKRECARLAVERYHARKAGAR